MRSLYHQHKYFLVLHRAINNLTCLFYAVITTLRAYAISGRHWYATMLIVSLLLVGFVYDIVRDSETKISALILRTPRVIRHASA